MFQLNKIYSSKLLNIYIIPFIIGSFSVMSFPPFNLTFINFIIFPLLFFLIINIKKKSKSKFRKKPYLFNLFICGYFFGIGFFLFGNYWISYSLSFDKNFSFLIPFAIIIIPIALGLFYGLASLISGVLIEKNFSSILIFSSVFSSIDLFRGKIFTGFPWNLWAYSLSWADEFIQCDQ